MNKAGFKDPVCVRSPAILSRKHHQRRFCRAVAAGGVARQSDSVKTRLVWLDVGSTDTSASASRISRVSHNPLATTYEQGGSVKGVVRVPLLMNNFKALPTLPDHLPAGNAVAMKTSTVCFANTFQRNELRLQLQMRKLEWFKIDWITDLERDWNSKHPQRCFINH